MQLHTNLFFLSFYDSLCLCWVVEVVVVAVHSIVCSNVRCLFFPLLFRGLSILVVVEDLQKRAIKTQLEEKLLQ